MRWFQNLKISIKLLISFSIAVILLGIVGVMGVIGTSKINKDLEDALNVRLPALDYLIESDRDLQQLLVAERSMIFANTQSEVFKKLVADYEENLRQSQERMQKFESLPLTSQEKEIIESYKKARKEWEELSKQIVQGRQEDTREGRRLAIDLSLNQANRAFEKMRDYLDQLQNVSLDIAEKSRQAAQQIYSRTFLIVVILTAAAILIVIILLGLMNRTVSHPIKQMMTRTRELAEGRADLTKRLMAKGKDEVGLLAGFFNKWIERIQGIITNVKSSSREMLGSIDEIAAGSQELASRTNQQAASITETSTTMEEFTSILKQSSENASLANSRLMDFDQQVKNKRELIQNVTATMAEIEKSSKQIGNIMNVINDISFQTNLLALNAAVEAARAGEAGRGFAVVASEVRNLAQKTAESSKTIQEIVTTNVNSTEKGMELVFETEEFFEAIMKILNELSDIIQSIENGSREQSTGMEQINQAVVQLDNVINQNAQLVNNFAKTSKEMNANAGQLQTLMEQFITDASREIPAPDKTPPEKKKKEPGKEKKTEARKPENTSEKAQSTADDFFSTDDESFEEF